jgi:hypothetical protein
LADLFEAAVDLLDETMRAVMGGGTEDQYKALSTPNPDPYKLPVANFFNGGWFLLNDNSEAVQLALNSVYGNIQPKVANNVMKAAQFYLVARLAYPDIISDMINYPDIRITHYPDMISA